MIATRIAPNSFSAGALARPSRSPRPPSWFKGDPTSKGKEREGKRGEGRAARAAPLWQIPGYAPVSSHCKWRS